MKRTHYNQAGFTIIEMIVSLALFSVVVTISVGALLVLIGTNDRLQVEQSIMTNLSFALDSMSREIRTGTYYYCLSTDTDSFKFGSTYDIDDIDEFGNQNKDCAGGRSDNDEHGIAFKEAGGSITGSSNERIMYYFDKSEGQLYRKIGNATESIIPANLSIVNADFVVTGSTPLSDASPEYTQPTVTIFIEAADLDDDSNKTYFVQTTVTQRTLDI